MRIGEKNAATLYFLFRVIIGVVFLLHGIQKVPGIMAGTMPALMIAAGIIEIVAGAFLVIGLWVRPVAIVAAIEMAYAFLVVHVYADGAWIFNPLANKGEPALLFFAAFLALIAHGAGKWGIDKKGK
jgi:putative oxidoreductase